MIVGLAAAIAAGYFATVEAGKAVRTRRHLAALATADGDAGKKAAWWVADGVRMKHAGALRGALQRPDISEDFREAIVYSLGKIRDAAAVPDLFRLLSVPGGSVVRQSSWLSLARIDADVFRKAIAEPTYRHDDWDELGIAQGLVEIGDPSGVMTVLRFAGGADRNQRQIACRTLDRSVRPVLETAGRWPADQRPKPGEIWNESLIRIVEQRVREVDLRQVALDTARHAEGARGVQKNVRRIQSGRDYLAWFLVGPRSEESVRSTWDR